MANRGLLETLNSFTLRDYLKELEENKRTVKLTDIASKLQKRLEDHGVTFKLSKKAHSRWFSPTLKTTWLLEIPRLEAAIQEALEGTGFTLGDTSSHSDGYSFPIRTSDGNIYVSVNITGNPHCHIIKKEREPSPYDYDNVVVCN